MNKRIKATPSILAAIKRANGGAEVDASQIAIYETKTINTMTLRKRGGLYEGARVDRSVLEDMVSTLNASEEGIPIHMVHNDDVLNVGKAFQAKLVDRPDGHQEVRTLFFVPLSETALVGRIDTGTVDQVSVGLIARQVKCSKCDFDWRKDASITNYMNLTDKKGHTIGKDGVHVISTGGLDAWFELSLVAQGAANDARIVSADNAQIVDIDSVYKLAASNQNHPETAIPLIANLDEMFSEESADMNNDEIQAMIDAALTASAADNQSKIDAAVEAAVKPKDDKIAELEATIAELKPKAESADATKVAELTATIGTLTTDRDAMFGFLKEQALAAQIAAGSTAPVEPTTHEDAITKIKDSGVNLVNLFARKETTTIAQDGASNVDSLRAYQRAK